MRVSSAALWLLAAASISATAQTPPIRVPRTREIKPYTIVQTVTTTQIFSNGMTYTHTAELVTMRDSQQRQRTEREMTGVPAHNEIFNGRTTYDPARENFKYITIYDPVERVNISWSTDPNQRHEATLTHNREFASTPRPRDTAKPPDQSIPVVEHHTESLGDRALAGGVMAHGMRTTIKYPAGYEGVSQEYTFVQETWVGPDGMYLEGTTDNPRGSKTVTTLVSYSDQEPDPALFKPPADYKILETKTISPEKEAGPNGATGKP